MPVSGPGAARLISDEPMGPAAKALVARVSELSRLAPAPSKTPAVDWSSEEGQWILQNRLANADVPPLYAEATWDKVRNPQGLMKYANDLPKHAGNGRGLILTGPVGTGKSSMAALVTQVAVKSGLSILWQHVPALVALLNHGDKKDVSETFRRALRPAVLVWDDFWLGELAPWQRDEIDRLIEFRYARRRSIILTTNVPRKALEKDESIARIMDRLGERTFWITVAGESMRKSWKESR